MQTNRVRNLPISTPAPSPRDALRAQRLRTLCAVCELAVTAIIGLGVLVCFALVFTML